MATYVLYVPESRVIDLASLSAGDYQLVTGLHGEIQRGDEVLLCLRKGGGDSEMYIKQMYGKYFAAHYQGEGHGKHPIALESPAHQRQKDYWARAAEANGLHAATEVAVRGGTLDVAITGGLVDTDIEVQRQAITSKAVKARTTKYHHAGYLPVWFNDWGRRPRWLYAVPSLGCNAMPWDEILPAPRAVTATGLTTVTAARCETGTFQRCPDGHPRACGKPHPQRSPWLGLAVDDVAGMIPAAEIQPLLARDGQVYLVSPASFSRYQDLTGGLGTWEPGRKPRRRQPRKRQPEPCRYAGHDQPAPPHDPSGPAPSAFDGTAGLINTRWTATCAHCQAAPPGPGGILCPACTIAIQTHNRLLTHGGVGS